MSSGRSAQQPAQQNQEQEVDGWSSDAPGRGNGSRGSVRERRMRREGRAVDEELPEMCQVTRRGPAGNTIIPTLTWTVRGGGRGRKRDDRRAKIMLEAAEGSVRTLAAMRSLVVQCKVCNSLVHLHGRFAATWDGYNAGAFRTVQTGDGRRRRAYAIW